MLVVWRQPDIRFPTRFGAAASGETVAFITTSTATTTVFKPEETAASRMDQKGFAP
jgi:hypothetical protein